MTHRPPAEHKKPVQLEVTRRSCAIAAVVAGVVIGVPTIVVAIALLGRPSATERAMVDVNRLGSAVLQYRTATGELPATLDQLVSAPADWHDTWTQPIAAIPLDPWGTPYFYGRDSDGEGGFVIVCWGRNEGPGGKGDKADVVYRVRR